MPSASPSLVNRFLPYLFIIMIILVFMIYMLLSAAISPNPMKIFFIILLIILMACIVIVIVWFRKMSFKAREIPDYSLQTKPK